MYLKKIFAITTATCLLISSCKKDNPTFAPPPTGEEETCVQSSGINNGEVIPGQYIIAYEPGVVAGVNGRSATANDMRVASESTLQRYAIPVESLQATFGAESGGFVARLSDAQLAVLKKDVSISMIEPDRIVALSTCFTVAAPRLVTWNIERVGYGDGIGKTAWVIDTGIDFDHPDLSVDQTRSRSFLTDDISAEDGNGHGTHVAGIIGAKNNSIGVLGVASGANLVSLRVLDADGEGSLSGILQALSYVNANGKAGDVVNMSLGEDVSSPIFIQQVQNTAAKGIYIAIAAGNDGKAANLYSPGNTNGTNIYTVSAIDSLDRFASFSNFGNDVVDFAAPGVRILSTYSEGRYAYLSGTSMAAPHVAGLLLLRGRAIRTSGSALNDPDGLADPIAHY